MKYLLDLPNCTLEKIKDRNIYLFDMSVWNRLADKDSKESIEIRNTLIDLKNNGYLFCPLCATNIWELQKQSGISLKRTSELMENLSLNVTFRDINQIFDYEVSHFIRYLLTDEFVPLSIDELFGSLLCYLSPIFELKDNGNDTVQDKSINQIISNLLKNISLSFMIDIIREKSISNIKVAPEYQNASIFRRIIAKEDRKKMERIEEEIVAKTILLPRLEKQISILPIEQQLYINNKLSKLPKSKKYNSIMKYILPYFPAISSYIKIATVSGYDTNRKDKENDFYDREILIYGLSYSSVFVAIDRWIKDLIGLIRKESDDTGVQYIDNLSELKKFTNSLNKDSFM